MYYKCYDVRYIFHVMRLLHLADWIQSAHFVCFGHKSRFKNAIYLKQVGYTRQQIKQRIQEQSTCILLSGLNKLMFFLTE